jgi:hypothetical protein
MRRHATVPARPLPAPNKLRRHAHGDEMFYRYQQSLIDEAATTLAALLQRVRHPHA